MVNADGEQNADVYIRGGKVEKVVDRTDSAAAAAAIHEAEADVAEWRVIDAKEKYVMPGGIDPHTHFEMPFMGQVRCCVAINKSPMFDPHTMQCFLRMRVSHSRRLTDEQSFCFSVTVPTRCW